MSVDKTSIYYAGLKPLEMEEISTSTGLTAGSLPVRYLGVPLCTKKLSMLNCAPLIQSIKSKFLTWTENAVICWKVTIDFNCHIWNYQLLVLCLYSFQSVLSGDWCSLLKIPVERETRRKCGCESGVGESLCSKTGRWVGFEELGHLECCLCNKAHLASFLLKGLDLGDLVSCWGPWWKHQQLLGHK